MATRLNTKFTKDAFESIGGFFGNFETCNDAYMIYNVEDFNQLSEDKFNMSDDCGHCGTTPEDFEKGIYFMMTDCSGYVQAIPSKDIIRYCKKIIIELNAMEELYND